MTEGQERTDWLNVIIAACVVPAVIAVAYCYYDIEINDEDGKKKGSSELVELRSLLY